METEDIKKQIDTANWHSELDYEQWVALPVSGPRPAARYKVILCSVLLFNLLLQNEIKSCCIFLCSNLSGLCNSER